MTKKLLPLALLCAFSAGAQASIINGGFESGLNGWSTLLATDPAKVTVVSSAADYAGNAYTPTEGSAMLDLVAGFPWTAVYQEFHVDEESTLSFDWAFLRAGRILPGGIAGVWIGESDAFSLPTALSLGSYFSGSGWNEFSQEIDPGDVTIAFFSDKAVPLGNSAQLLIDDLRLDSVAAIPEPNTLALLFAGLGIIATRRNKKSVN